MTNQKTRPSKRKIWRNLLTTSLTNLFFSYMIASIFALEEISETESELNFQKLLIIGLPIFVIILIVNICINYGIYRNEYYYFADDKMNYEFTFIIKKRLALPVVKINIVKVKRNIIDLIMKTAVLEIGSGSLTTSLKAEIKLCLDKDYAYQFADFVQRYSKAVKEGTEFNEEMFKVEEQTATLIKKDEIAIKMSIGDKFRYIMTNLVISAIFIIILAILFILVIFTNLKDVFSDAETTDIIIGVIVYGFMFFIFPTGYSILKAFIAYYDYKIVKTEDGINISYGLINKKSILVTFDKIHGYAIRSNLLEQIFRIGRLKLNVIGMDDTAGQNNTTNATYLYPCGSIRKISEIIKVFVPTYHFTGTVYKSTKKSAIHTIGIPLVTTMIIMFPLLLYLAVEVNILLLICPYITMIIFSGFSSILVCKNAAFGINKDYVYTQSGGFIRIYTVIKTHSVQRIAIYAGFIRRKHGLSTYDIVYRGTSLLTSRIFVRNVPTINLDEFN